MLKRRTLVCLALAIVAAGVGIFLCLPRTPQFTEEQFDRIQNGMTLAEVEAVLGCPPGEHAQRKMLALFATWDSYQRDYPEEQLREWLADTPEPLFADEHGPSRQRALGIRVWFNGHGKCTDKDRSTYTYTPPTLLERLRAWVGW